MNAFPQIVVFDGPIDGMDHPRVGVPFHRELGLDKAAEGQGEALRFVPERMKGSGKDGELVLRRPGQRWVEQGEIFAQGIFAAAVGEREKSRAGERIEGFSQAGRGAVRRVFGNCSDGLHRRVQSLHAKRLASGGDCRFFRGVARSGLFHAAKQPADPALSALGERIDAAGRYQTCRQT